jgi:diaminopimelate decarboxylase
MGAFAYRQDTLYCEDVAMADIARREGTPCYVYSTSHITTRLREYDKAFGAPAPHLLFRQSEL